MVLLNEEDLPILKLNREYQGMMKSDAMGKMARDYLSDCYKSAQWLLKSIQQRQNTLCKVTESIVKFQRISSTMASRTSSRWCCAMWPMTWACTNPP